MWAAAGLISYLIAYVLCSVLSGDALAALQEFYSERDEHEKSFEHLRKNLDKSHDSLQTPLSMKTFSENWNASQFWVRRHLGPFNTI